MSEITLAGCAPDVLLSHLAMYGLAAILESEGVSEVRAVWSTGGDERPVLSAPEHSPKQIAAAISQHARKAHGPQSWLQRSISVKSANQEVPRAMMSPRLGAFDDDAWRHAQAGRQQVLDELTGTGSWLDLRFLAALGEPCYWVRNRQGKVLQDNAASRLEMQPRNQGAEFVGTRLRRLAAEVAARSSQQILSGVLGQTVLDEAGGNAADSRTATGLAPPGPTDNALAWCALWGISQLPLAMRVQSDPRISVMAITSGHFGSDRGDSTDWFYAPIWEQWMRPAKVRTILAAKQTRNAASRGLDSKGRPMPQDGTVPVKPMISDNEIAASQRWLRDRHVTGVMRFPVGEFGSSSARERRAQIGEPVLLTERR